MIHRKIWGLKKMNQLDLVNIYFIMFLFILCMCVTVQMSRSEDKMPESGLYVQQAGSGAQLRPVG